MNEDLSTKSFQELRKLCGERGLSAAGTSADLIERLTQAQGPAPETAPAPKRAGAVSEREVEKEWKADALRMKMHLDAQPKVRIMVAHEPGVDVEASEKMPFIANLNGYRYEVPRGVYVDVPQQIADLITERLQSEGKIGRQHLVTADPAKQTALG
jgi:hypothetical protein